MPTIAGESAQVDPLSAQWRAREEARQRVAQLRAGAGPSLVRALERVLSLGAAGLRTERSTLWLVDEASQTLRCALQLDQGRLTANPGGVRIRDVGPYARALEERRVLAVGDVSQEPLTRELCAAYFGPAGIQASLDAPLYLDGRVRGALCHEHRGGVRTWTAADADLAISLAELVALVYAAHEHREAEAALADAEERLAELKSTDAITRLARGVAHDVNNVLGVIMLAVGALERKATEPEAVLQAAGNIGEAAESAARLARQLYAVGGERSGNSPARRADVDVTLRGLEPTLRALVGELRTLRVIPGAAQGVVRLVPSQLEQILLNLVGNARDAIGPAGHIEVSSRLDTWMHRGRSTEAVAIEVRDDGRGMDDAARARIFEPFFSTKTAKGHKGLGLATTLGTVQEVGGAIHVESAPGKGALFRVLLPRLA